MKKTRTWLTSPLFLWISMIPAAVRAEGAPAEPGPLESTAATPQASDTAEAAANAFWEGKRLYDAGQYDRALTAFEIAYAATNEPMLLYDMAQCQRQLGNCRAAKHNYQQCRERVSDPTLIQRATERLSELEQSCVEDPIPQRSPARAVPMPSQAPAEAAKPAQTDVASTSARLAPEKSKAPGLDTAQARSWGVPLALLAGGVLTGACAVGAAIWNHERYRSWTDHNAGLKLGTAPGESELAWAVRQRANDELGNSIESTRRVTLVLGVVSGTALVASAVSFFALQGTRSGPVAALRNERVSPQITPGNYQLQVSGSF